MPKLILMKGLPGCGKSTRAEEIMKTNKVAVRLNKDLLREMLHFNHPNKHNYVFNGRQEDEVRKAQRDLAYKFLLMGKDVIIDDTNLNPKTLNAWIELTKELHIKHEIIDMTDIDCATCVLHDIGRMEKGERYVGSTVIKNMAIQWGLVKFDADSVVICDIDGTIADTTNRERHLQNGKKDWKSFFSEIGTEDVRQLVIKDVIDLYNKGKTIIFVSGRPDTYKGQTLKWLNDKLISFGFTLIMRNGNDNREDSIVKEEILNTYFPDKQVIHCCFDDRPRVIRMWRKNGLLVHDVGNGIEF